jgi:hypothetical protein
MVTLTFKSQKGLQTKSFGTGINYHGGCFVIYLFVGSVAGTGDALIGEYDIAVLTVSEEAEKLADIYVSESVIPVKYRTDGVHIALPP